MHCASAPISVGSSHESNNYLFFSAWEKRKLRATAYQMQPSHPSTDTYTNTLSIGFSQINNLYFHLFSGHALLCLSKLSFLEEAYPHLLQTWSLILSCTPLMCLLKSLLKLDLKEHLSHLNFFSPIFPFKWTFIWCIFKCCFVCVS